MSKPLGPKFQSSNAISDQQFDHLISADPSAALNALEHVFIGGIKDLFQFMRKEKINPRSVEWGTFRARFIEDFQMLAYRVEFALNLKDPTPMSNLNAIAKEIYAAKIDAMLSESQAEVATKYGYGKIKISDDDLSQYHAASHHVTHDEIEELKDKLMTPSPPPKPKPLTYLELKQKALAEGKLAIPPLDDDKPDLV